MSLGKDMKELSLGDGVLRILFCWQVLRDQRGPPLVKRLEEEPESIRKSAPRTTELTLHMLIKTKQ
jgi:hypothetical protein